MPVEENIEHCKDGVITELGELLDTYKRHRYYGKDLDLVNIKEEAGDIFWYFINIFKLEDWWILDFKEYEHLPEQQIIDMTLTNYSYDYTINQRIRNIVGFQFTHLHSHNHANSTLIYMIQLFEDMDLNIEEICNINIAKLEKRYKDKVFNAEQAINRDVEKERKILEGE